MTASEVYMGRSSRRKRRALARARERLYATHPRYYLAYGSNHNKGQMSRRCATARPLCTARLDGWRLFFSGPLSIERSDGDYVPLSVWMLEAGDIASLDIYEGYPYSYDKMYLDVTIDGEKHKAFTYVMTGQRVEYAPSYDYYMGVVEGYSDFGLDREPLSEAYERVRWRKGFDVSKWVDYQPCDVCGVWVAETNLIHHSDGSQTCNACAGYHKTDVVPDLYWSDNWYPGGNDDIPF